MGSKGSSFDDIKAEAEQLLRVWNDNADLALGDLTEAQFQAMVTAFNTTRASVDGMRTQLTKGVNDLNRQAAEIQEITVRARSVARGQYGLDSTQYDQLGGTRASERKPRKKKTPPKS
jgi:hypothetical protein